tara:strand:+ start:141 stop:476 length:336 start_codon:yes stop_codon:yes gene_type:complete
MSGPVFIIQTTLPSSWKEFEVGSFSQHLVETGAACVHRSTIESMYRWGGKIESTSEWSLEIKVSSDKKEDVLEKVKELHPYEIPQILHWQVETSEEYGFWVNNTDTSTSSL